MVSMRAGVRKETKLIDLYLASLITALSVQEMQPSASCTHPPTAKHRRANLSHEDQVKSSNLLFPLLSTYNIYNIYNILQLETLAGLIHHVNKQSICITRSHFLAAVPGIFVQLIHWKIWQDLRMLYNLHW